MKKIILILTMIILTVSCQKQDDETLRVGMEVGYAPFNWFQNDDSNNSVKIKNGYANGYDVQIAKIIADKLGKKLEIVQSDWDSLLGPALNSDKIDLVIAGVSPTSNRKQSMDFSTPYYKTDMVVLVKNDSKYSSAKTKKDFKDAKISAQLNTIHYDLIDQLEGVNKQSPLDSAPVLLTALLSNRIDGYVTEKPAALAAQLANKNLKMIELEDKFDYDPSEVDISIGIKKGNKELLEKVNEILSGISLETRENLMLEAIQNQPLSQ